MNEKKSILTEMLERRIPQILGVYIASVWLAVEVSEWIIERFDAPDQTSSYVGVIMISFLPLVALLAWGHGRPGKDKWTQKQLMFIPVNMILAYFAVTTFIKPVELTSEIANSPTTQATEIMALTDVQTGQLVEYEVAKSGMSQKVAGFFWENKTGDESLDWLSYGSMWMIAKDLMRNPIISIRTPYDSGTMKNGIINKGFERALGTPFSLSLDLSKNINAQWMINGQITKNEGKVIFEASLYDVITGALVTTTTSSYDNLLFALDDVAEQLAAVILEKADIPTNIIPEMPISEYISNNLMAIESVIRSLNFVTMDNDYENGITALGEAIDNDKQLAEAHVLKMDYYRAMGDIEAAKLAAEAALSLEYKLSPRDALKVKANYYAIQNDSDKAIRVLENWTKLEPESADALMALGRNYIIVGNRLDDALEVYTKLSEIQKSNATALINQARIFRLKDNQEMAIKALKLFAESSPESETPWLEMGATYLQFGDLAKARESYEEASLLSFNKISADLALAKLDAYQGEIETGLQAIDRLMEKSISDSAKVQILNEKEVILSSVGQIREALDVVLQARKFSESYMRPLQLHLTYGSKEAAYLAYLHDDNAAWKKLDEVKQQVKPPYDSIMGVIEVTIYEQKGNFKKAEEKLIEFEQFTKAANMSLYDQFIRSFKAVLARETGDLEKAIEFHDLAIAESKQSFITLNTLHVLDDLVHKKAETLFEMGLYEETLNILNNVMRRNPLLGNVKLLAAKAHIELEQFDQAQNLVNDVKTLWANANSDFNHLKDLAEVESLLPVSSS